MATLRLANATVASTEAFYLDTSALVALAHHAASRKGAKAPALDVQRGADLTAFLTRLVTAGGAARTTVLAYEEVAASTRNKLRFAEAEAANFSGWKPFKSAEPAKAAGADARSHAAMLEMLSLAASAAGSLGVTLEWPAPTSASPVTIRRHHRELLRKHPEVDAMDALHIVVGLAIGIRSFITFDGGWDAVPGITIVK